MSQRGPVARHAPALVRVDHDLEVGPTASRTSLDHRPSSRQSACWKRSFTARTPPSRSATHAPRASSARRARRSARRRGSAPSARRAAARAAFERGPRGPRRPPRPSRARPPWKSTVSQISRTTSVRAGRCPPATVRAGRGRGARRRWRSPERPSSVCTIATVALVRARLGSQAAETAGQMERVTPGLDRRDPHQSPP